MKARGRRDCTCSVDTLYVWGLIYPWGKYQSGAARLPLSGTTEQMMIWHVSKPVLMLRAASDRHPCVRLHIWMEKGGDQTPGWNETSIAVPFPGFSDHVQVPIIFTSNVNQRTRSRRSHLLPYGGIWDIFTGRRLFRRQTGWKCPCSQYHTSLPMLSRNCGGDKK